jgi:hypothetical protein
VRTTEKNFTATVRRRATQLLAALFVLYAFADISVLQVYSGNETVGIPSYAQQLQIEKQKSKLTENTENSVGAKPAADSSGSSQERQTPIPHSSEENCFGCCSHILLGFNLAQSIAREILPTKITASNFFDHDRLQSDSHLQQLYQPPKFA